MMFERIEKWLRWQIAVLLDRRRDTCWADLVLWAIFPENHDFLEILSPLRGGRCLNEGPYIYCGKCDMIQSLKIAEIKRLRQIFSTLKFQFHSSRGIDN